MSEETSRVSKAGIVLAFVEQLWRRGGWMPTLVFVLHLVLHEGFDAYAAYPALDVPMHLLGGLAIAFAGWRGAGWLWAPVTLSAGPAVRNVLIVGLTSLAALLWEFAEFLSDRYLGTRVQAGLNDTLLDMAMGLAGGIGYVAWLTIRGEATVPALRSPAEDGRSSTERTLKDPV